MKMKPTRIAAALLGLALLAGCATNPVTGKTDLMLVGEESELQIGRQNYAPMQQAEGGVYELDPDLVGYVQQVGQRLAAVSDRALPYEFTVLNNSVPNAWALPGGKIAVNRGLLTELRSESELAAVLSHEIVHAAARHSAQAMSRGMLIQGGLVAAQVAFSDSDYGSIYLGGAALAAQLLTQRYSREAELESDRYGMRYMSRAGYDPAGAVSLQETFVRLSEGRQSDWLSGLFASHPPSPERVAENRRTAAGLPAGGLVGADAYQAALARTRKAKPAYDLYDEGRKSLAAKRPDIALQKAQQAIALEPAEANFHALKGDALLLQKDYPAARSAYTAALERNDHFFYFHLQRGLVAERLRDDAAAARDLQASLELLPTGPAHYALGNIALRARRHDVALRHFEIAAGSQGELGAAALAAMMRLDLPANPEKYLRQQAGLDANGMLVVAIGNPTRLPVTGVRLGVQFRDASGQVRQWTRDLRGVLAAGQQSQIATGLGPFGSATEFRVAIVGARVAE